MNKKVAVCKPGREFLPETILPAPWSWASQLLGLWEIHFCWLSHTVCNILLWQPNQPNHWCKSLVTPQTTWMCLYKLVLLQPTLLLISPLSQFSFPFPVASFLNKRLLCGLGKRLLMFTLCRLTSRTETSPTLVQMFREYWWALLG